MKDISITTALYLALVIAVSGQYLSEGWKPGQAVTATANGYTSAAYSPHNSAVPNDDDTPTAYEGISSLFDLTNILQSGPVKSLLDSVGVNITERLEAAKESARIWDERIPLITDSNYQEIVLEEKFETLEEERDRVWFFVITITSAQPEGISRFVDNQFDLAFNLTQDAKDLQHVRWGRIDYMNVTALTTKWNVWRAPYLVVAKDRGQTLRFYRPQEIRVQGEILREFLKRRIYEQTPPWHSAFGPGGSREFVTDYVADIMATTYNYTTMVPRWALLLITGTLASFLVNLLHSSRLFSQPAPRPQPPGAAVRDANAPSTMNADPVVEKTPQRKTGNVPTSRRRGVKK